MKFYELKIDAGKKKHYAYAFPAYGYPTEEVNCSVCGRKWNSFKKIYEEHRSYSIVLTNEIFSDFMACGADYLVSENVKKYLEKINIKNVRFAEMPVVSKTEIDENLKKVFKNRGINFKKISDLKPKYYRIGSYVSAELHPDSKIVWQEDGEDRCKYCGYGVGYYPLEFFLPEYILLKSWDGSDLFKVKEFMGTLFCTEKLKLLIEEQKFTGVLFKEVLTK